MTELDDFKTRFDLTYKDCLEDIKASKYCFGCCQNFEYASDDNDKITHAKIWISDYYQKTEDHYMNYVIYIRDLASKLNDIKTYLESLKYKLYKFTDEQYYILVDIKEQMSKSEIEKSEIASE